MTVKWPRLRDCWPFGSGWRKLRGIYKAIAAVMERTRFKCVSNPSNQSHLACGFTNAWILHLAIGETRGMGQNPTFTTPTASDGDYRLVAVNGRI